MRWEFCLNFPRLCLHPGAREPGSSRLLTHRRSLSSGHPSTPRSPVAALTGSQGAGSTGPFWRALGKGRLELAPECLISPRPCRVPHLGWLGSLSGGLWGQGRGSQIPGWTWPALPKTQGRDWLWNGPICAGGGELPGQPQPHPTLISPCLLCGPGSSPASSHHTAPHPVAPATSFLRHTELFPPQGLGPCSSPFPEPLPLCSSHGTFPFITQVSAGLSPPQKDFPDLIHSRDLPFDTSAPCWFSSGH